MSDNIPLSLSELPLLLRFIPADSRETWVAVGMGIKAEFGEAGWDAWNDWSQSGTGYKLADAKSVWKSFRKSGTGLGSVIKLAQDNGWTPEKKELTAEQKRQFVREQEARRAKRQAEIEADEALLAVMRTAVAGACQRIWAEHASEQGSSPYLDKKQVQAWGVRFMARTVVLEIDDQEQRCQIWEGEHAQTFLKSVPKPRPAHLSMLVLKRGDLVIALRDELGVIQSLQQINPLGNKLFPRYGRKAGCFHVLGEHLATEVIGIAEGYATAASCLEAAGWPVVMAVDSGNMPAVARAIRAKHPAARIVLCGDDDPTKPGNPGRTKAEAAALEVGGVAVFPAGGHGKDWNDLQVAEGLDAVREQLVAALELAALEAFDAFAADGGDSLPCAPSLECAGQDDSGQGDDGALAHTHAGGGGFRISEQELVSDFVVVYGTDTAWDCKRARMVKLSAIREAVGRTRYKWWQESEHRRMAQDVVFDPTERCGPLLLNLYDGFKVQQDERGADGCLLIRRHLGLLCNNRVDEYTFLLKWIAYPLQNPGAKMATAVVMFGAEGPGKSLLWEQVVRRIYGEYGTTIGQAQLESQFTGWQSRKLFALAEEVVSREEMRHYKGVLKHLVTGETLQINEKNMPVREEANHLNFVFLSNSTVPLALDDGDRRYLVLYVDRVPPAGYFQALVQEIENGGIEAFYHYLMNLDLTGFSPHSKPPLNDEKQALIDGSLAAPRYFVRRWMAGETEFPVTGAVTQADLWQAFCKWCEGANEFKRRERDFQQEAGRDLLRERPDIKYPTTSDDFKTTRIYVTPAFAARKAELGRSWAAEAGVQCRKFGAHFDRRSIPAPGALD